MPWSALTPALDRGVLRDGIVPFMSTTAGQIAESLFGRIRRELLSILLLNPERPFFLLELVALLRTGRGGVQRELASLVESGVAVRERDGSRTYYRAVSDAPGIGELTALLRVAADPGRLMEECITGLADGIVFALRSPASLDSSNHAVMELLVAGTLSPADLRTGLTRMEMLSGSRVREVLVTPQELTVFLHENRDLPWLERDGSLLLIGDWPDAGAALIQAPIPEQLPDLFSTMNLDWDR
jgi:hypothetical protein